VEDDPAPAQHRHPVGGRGDLGQLVADQDHRAVLAAHHLAQHPEQLGRLGLGEHRGGLVQDEHRGVAAQALDQLHPLPLARREPVHPGRRIDRQPVPAADLLDLRACPGPVDPAGVAQDDVLPDGQRLDQAEVLVHHADPERHRLLRAAGLDRAAVAVDRSRVPPDQPEQDLHERGLARAVLAQQAVDLAPFDGQVHAVAGDDLAVGLADPAQPQRGRPPLGRCPSLVGHVTYRASPLPRRP
jgi:hypothetical protein